MDLLIEGFKSDLDFMLFANCIAVRGANRSIICDLQNQYFKFIPNDLFELLQENRVLNVASLVKTFGEHNESTILGYVKFLLKQNFGFFCNKDDRDNFGKLNLSFERPSRITNAIIDLSLDNFELEYRNYVRKSIEQLDVLGCKAMLLRFFGRFSLDQLELILDFFDGTGIECIDVWVEFSSNLQDVGAINEMLDRQLRVFDFVVYNSPHTQTDTDRSRARSISFLTINVRDETHCGEITHKSFSVNIPLFSESQCHNNCLYLKIGIDKYGNLKNCPSMTTTFGNISKTKIEDVIDKKQFRKLWSVSKDQIDVCRDCEFRYICTDCRAFIPESEVLNSKPVKCSYDPYKSTWS